MTPTPTCKINLALQGGGSHGALTWGVLDALLEDGSLVFDGISGTSAGAMNAVALAQGFAKAARQESDPVAAQALGAELARATLTELWEGVGTMGSLMWGAPLPGSPFMGVLNQFFSPYQTNPLDINPLRKLLERVVDFEALTHPPMEGVVPKVFVCATNVRTGRGCIFSGRKLSADAVMASACLPQLFKAVEIDGEPYWDGGFSGNPALWPMIHGEGARDLIVVQLVPDEVEAAPTDATGIRRWVSEIVFNSSLIAEMQAIS